jgi:hypothetical protein
MHLEERGIYLSPIEPVHCHHSRECEESSVKMERFGSWNAFCKVKALEAEALFEIAQNISSIQVSPELASFL